jgi:hypothetical protein
MPQAATAAVHHLPDLPDMVAELTDQTRHREILGAYKRNVDGSQTWVSRDRWAVHPSLLDQLRSAVEASTSTEEGARPGFGSAPAARLEAVDAYLRIEREAAAALKACGQKVPAVRDIRGAFVDVATAIRRYHATVPIDEALPMVRSWWATARVVTGWDSPPWRPDARCLACDAKGGLRIRLAQQAGVCVLCGSTWDPETIGLLAEHVRAEAAAKGDQRGASPMPVGGRNRDGGTVVCHCAVCDPEYPYWRLCPVCGHVGLGDAPACQKPLDHRFGCTGPVV